MVAKPPVDVFQVASDAWQTAMDQKKFEDAIKAGIDAYLHYCSEDNQKLSMGALNLIYLAAGRLIFGDKATETLRLCCCSFCGRSGPDVRLGAGPEAFICSDCVGIFYEELVTNRAG
jgi:hypothetical protein